MSAPAEPGETRSVAASSGLLLAGRLAGNAGFLVAVLVLARALGPSGRGTIAFLTVTALVLARLTALGVPSATIVFAAQRREARPALLSTLTAFTAGSALAGGGLVFGLLAAVPAARPIDADAALLAAFVAGTLVAALVEAGYTFLLGCSRFRQHALVTASAPWLYAVILAVVELTRGLEVGSAAVAWIVANAAWAALLLAASARGVGFGRPSVELIVESLRFGIRAWAGGLARFLNFRVDQVLMGFLASEAALGIYATAVNAAEVLLYVPGVVATALVPLAARSDAVDRGEQALRVFRMTTLLTLGSLVVAATAGAALIPVAFGERFTGAVTPFLILLPGALGFAAMRIFSSALVAASLPTRSSLGPLVALVVGIVADIALIPPFGASGAAVASTVAFAAGGAVAMCAFRGAAPFGVSAVTPRPSDVSALWKVVGRGATRLGLGARGR